MINFEYVLDEFQKIQLSHGPAVNCNVLTLQFRKTPKLTDITAMLGQFTACDQHIVFMAFNDGTKQRRFLAYSKDYKQKNLAKVTLEQFKLVFHFTKSIDINLGGKNLIALEILA